MNAPWLTEPLLALVRPGVTAVASDIWRRWQISRNAFTLDPRPLDTPPQITKAIADLEVLRGNNALISQSIDRISRLVRSTGRVVPLNHRGKQMEMKSDSSRTLTHHADAQITNTAKTRSGRDAHF
jgi:hypothetical protein